MSTEACARSVAARLLLERDAGQQDVLERVPGQLRDCCWNVSTAHAEASRTQGLALIDALRRCKDMKPGDRAILGELAQHVHWKSTDAP